MTSLVFLAEATTNQPSGFMWHAPCWPTFYAIIHSLYNLRTYLRNQSAQGERAYHWYTVKIVVEVWYEKEHEDSIFWGSVPLKKSTSVYTNYNIRGRMLNAKYHAFISK